MGNSTSALAPVEPLVLSETQKKEILNWITQDNILRNKLEPRRRVFTDLYGESNDCYYTSGRYVDEYVARRIVRKMNEDWGYSYASIGLSIGVSLSRFSDWRNYPGRAWGAGVSTIRWIRDLEISVESDQISRSVASAPCAT